MSGVSYLALAPEIVLSVGAVLVLLVGVFARHSVRLLGLMVGVIYLLTGLAIVFQWRQVDAEGARFSFEGTIFLDYSSVGVRAILLVVAVLGTATAWEMLVGLRGRFAEGVTLILIATAGFMLMGASADLVMIFVALEIGSIALYVLAGIVRSSLAGDEAALKYFLLGSFASAIFIYGGALVYTATGSTNLFVIAAGLSGVHVVRPALLLIGVGLLVVGLGFKVTAAPFHSWAPDVYQGAPSGVVGFMAAAAKVGGFAALINILTGGFERYASAWGNGLALMAAVSMVVGTLLAIGQSDVRRMLAYSGVHPHRNGERDGDQLGGHVLSGHLFGDAGGGFRRRDHGQRPRHRRQFFRGISGAGQELPGCGGGTGDSDDRHVRPSAYDRLHR